MVRLMTTGLLAGLFFSTTFVLNQLMSLEGGAWYWSAALRYAYMLFFLGLGLTAFKGGGYMRRLLGELWRNGLFWIVSGTIGFGCFYALITFAADFAPGWVIATTWQFTLIASLFVLMLFGRNFGKQIWIYSAAVFVGIFLVNAAQVSAVSLRQTLLGALPVLGAAFAYPLGNQLVWEAQRNHPRLPKIDPLVLESAFARVFLLAAGSVPFWLLLYFLTTPGAPSSGQLMNTALVALFSGVIATTLFLYARNRASTAAELAAVDATQASEVIFALCGEMLFLHAPAPGLTSILGIGITLAGLIAFARHKNV